MTDRYDQLVQTIVGDGEIEGIIARLDVLRSCLDDAATRLELRFGRAAGELLGAAVEDVEDVLLLGGDGGGRG